MSKRNPKSAPVAKAPREAPASAVAIPSKAVAEPTPTQPTVRGVLARTITAHARLPSYLTPEDHTPSGHHGVPDSVGRVLRAAERLYRIAVADAPTLEQTWSPDVVDRFEKWRSDLWRAAGAVHELHGRVMVKLDYSADDEAVVQRIAAIPVESLKAEMIESFIRTNDGFEARDFFGPMPPHVPSLLPSSPLYRAEQVLAHARGLDEQTARRIVADVAVGLRVKALELVQWVRTRAASIESATIPVVLLGKEPVGRRYRVQVSMAGATDRRVITDSEAKILREFASSRTATCARNKMRFLRGSIPEIALYVHAVPGSSGVNIAKYELAVGPVVREVARIDEIVPGE